MAARRPDVVILGAGLAGGLVALALRRARPELRVVLFEEGPAPGGNHVWSFFGSDVGAAGRELLAPMVAGAWPDYAVRFPGFERRLATSYYSITSERFAATLRKALPRGAIRCDTRVVACAADEVTLADGTRIAAGAVIDARGIRNYHQISGGWQKFLGRRLKLEAPHGLERPMIMDGAVEQHDGFRFVYCLPFAADEVFIEDTYYSDSPTIPTATLAVRIEAYARAQGWRVSEVLGEEEGLLPVVAGGDFDAFWRGAGEQVARAGSRAALFHPLTSYSLPEAVRFALALAEQPDLSGAALATFAEERARRHWQDGAFYRRLAAMLFSAAEPDQRWKVLARFYKLDRRLVERFYAGRSTFADKARILAGKPPVPLGRAISVLAAGNAATRPLNPAEAR